MSVIQTCRDTKDCLDLFRPQGLSLKPVSKLNISVQLPQLKKSGAKISNWEVMERSKEMARPHSFPVFKVVKSSLEFVRFEAEIENYGGMESVLAKLDMKTIKLSGFREPLKVRAAEAKPQFPTRSDWDSFFRNNRTMNEMKPGERPDTIHVRNLPTQWFVNHQDRSGVAKDRPSEFVVKKAFGTFGDVRAIDIPMLDPYRQKMKSGIGGTIQTFSFEQDLVFDAYVQYKEYVGFVKAMNSLKGMKLLYKDRYEDRCWVANIKVDYDKTKHLAESSVRKRSREREKIADEEREREEARRRKRDLEELKKAEELRKLEHEDRARYAEAEAERRDRVRRRTEREDRRRAGKMLKRTRTEDEAMAEKIAVEERKLVIAHRKLEAIRLLDELLERVKVVKSKGKKNREAMGKEKAPPPPPRKSTTTTTYKDMDEQLLRDRLIKRLKQKEVTRMDACGERLRNARGSGGAKVQHDDDDDDAVASVEDISEDDFENGEAVVAAAVDRMFSDQEDDDLRLTSTEEEEDITEEKKKKKRSKEKKKHKKGKKKKKKRSKNDDDDGDGNEEEEEEAKKKRRRELATQIDRAKKIADRERRSASREGRRAAGFPDRHQRSPPPPDNDEGYPDYRQRRRERRQREKLERLASDKRREHAKEEMYDRMMHPHLYAAADDDDHRVAVGGRESDRMRRPRKGEHYEQVQREYLEKEIRERRRRQQRRSSDRHRHPCHHHHDPHRRQHYSRRPPSRNDRAEEVAGGGRRK